MVSLSRFLSGPPVRIAAVYAAFGFLWIFVTDQLVFTFVDDPSRVTQLQTIKGWVFVALSAVLVYGLVYYRQGELERTNAELDSALRQTDILHRILRHNLRNSCNVIQGNAELLATHVSGEPKARLETIEAQNEQLIALSVKSKRLRDIVSEKPVPRASVDLVDVINAQIEAIRQRQPRVQFRTDLPDALEIETDARIDTALYELFENAVEHNDSERPTLWVSARTAADGPATIEIADEGPGMPAIEREVLKEGFETPTFHSQGLGLWIARTIVTRIGGQFCIAENEPRGTIVRISLPASPDSV